MIKTISTTQFFLNNTHRKDLQVQKKNISFSFKENDDEHRLKRIINYIFREHKKDYTSLTNNLNDLQVKNIDNKWTCIQLIAQELLKQDNLSQLTEHIASNFDEFIVIYAIKELCRNSITEQNIAKIINNNLNIIKDQDKPILKEILESDPNIKKLETIIKVYVNTYPVPYKDFLEDELGVNNTKLITSAFPIHKIVLENIRNAFINLFGLSFDSQIYDYEKAKVDETY